MTENFFSIPKGAKILPHVNEETGELPKVEPYHKLDAIPEQLLCEENCPVCQFFKEQYTKKKWEVLEDFYILLYPIHLIKDHSPALDLAALEEIDSVWRSTE